LVSGVVEGVARRVDQQVETARGETSVAVSRWVVLRLLSLIGHGVSWVDEGSIGDTRLSASVAKVRRATVVQVGFEEVPVRVLEGTARQLVVSLIRRRLELWRHNRMGSRLVERLFRRNVVVELERRWRAVSPVAETLGASGGVRIHRGLGHSGARGRRERAARNARRTMRRSRESSGGVKGEAGPTGAVGVRLRSVAGAVV
jgi:hypothetical protein